VGYTKKRVLVTGGTGFLGSHLCDCLLKEGYDVLCVDNFYTGSKRNIVHVLESPYFELYRHDITFPLYVEVDEIYNLACPASPIHYQNHPVQTTKVNVHGSINMLGLAEKVIELTNSRSEILFEPLPEDDPRQLQPDTTLARQILGWEPRVSLEKGLKKTIEYFRSVLYPL